MKTKTEEKQKYALRFWHKIKHDQFVVTDTAGVMTDESARLLVGAFFANGGFWDDNDAFVPWHNISYIKKVKP